MSFKEFVRFLHEKRMNNLRENLTVGKRKK